MKIQFPKPVNKRSVWVELPEDDWKAVAKIIAEKRITQEQTLSTLLPAALEEFRGMSKASDYTYELGHGAVVKPAHLDKLSPGAAYFTDKSEAELPVAPKGRQPGIHRAKQTPEQLAARAAHKAAYMRDYWKRHPEKYGKSSKPKAGKDTIVPTKPTKEERAAMVSPHQQKIIDNRKKEDDHIKSMVVLCANLHCPTTKSFIKGNGVAYKEKEYCSDKCLEMILNAGLEQGSLDTVETI